MIIRAPSGRQSITCMLFNTSTVGDLAKHDKNNVTALAELDWKPNDDLLLYAKYSRGVKSAGFNGTFLDVTDIIWTDSS